MKTLFSVLALVWFVCSALPIYAQTSPHKQTDTSEMGFSKAVLAAIASMPAGGGYATTKIAKDRCAAAIRDSSILEVSPKSAIPSFCSSATYLVFCQTISKLEAQRVITLSAKARNALLILDQADGDGIWGRWNANGPGTAKLFFDLHLGRNFTAIEDAIPGDFLKIWWSDAIGSKERGHSVIYLGTATSSAGNPAIRYWSSNKPLGYGEKTTELSKIKHFLFSRLEYPEHLNKVSDLPAKDPYLASMLKVEEHLDSMLRKLAVKQSATPNRKP